MTSHTADQIWLDCSPTNLRATSTASGPTQNANLSNTSPNCPEQNGHSNTGNDEDQNSVASDQDPNPPSENSPGPGGSTPSPSPSLLSLLTSSQWLRCPLAECQEVRQDRARLTSHLLHHPDVLDLLEAATPQAEAYTCTSLGPGRCFPVWAGRTQFLLHRYMMSDLPPCFPAPSFPAPLLPYSPPSLLPFFPAPLLPTSPGS